MSGKLNKSILASLLSLSFFVFTLILIFSSDLGFVNKFSDYTVHIMLAFIALGMFFLFLSKKRLMFTSFACSAIICLFLKQASNSNIVLPQSNNLPAVTVVHINLGSVTDNYDNLLTTIEEIDPDIVSLQEFTPDWNLFLHKELIAEFAHSENNVRIDPYGMALYSKYPLIETSMIYHNDIPNLKADISLEGYVISIFSSYVLPPFGLSAVDNTKEHLSKLESEINELGNAVLSLGDFNMVYWANEISQFRSNTQLLNSRREAPVGSLKMPYDHIFYSDDLECTSFQEIKDSNQSHIGIIGTYQFKTEIEEEEKIEIPSSLSDLNF
jgi:endonuclease/exonuclease/phosphatase (EEP) superfamily protein YafD